MSLIRAIGCGALLLLAAARPAFAGTFSVTPVRVELAQGRRTSVVTLRNPGDAPLTLQISLVDWSQADGEDRYRETHDLLATPPVFTIPANGEQIVRIALRREADPARELPYRIFFEEVPQTAPRDFNGLNVALRIGVPIFLLPRAAGRSDLSWELHALPDGRMQIDAINRGTAHVQVTDFDVSFGAADSRAHVGVVKYVLPGSRMSWIVTSPAGTGSAATARIHGFGDHGEFNAEVAIAPRP
jgi:fimbrial chaperone protein